jgi:3-deoxy-D-manno-octulosonate 8-phosphate phosphatase (KDO 8-P phosphatase)
MSNYKTYLKRITTFVLDYDGVMTNGTVILQPEGEPLRTAHVKDGYAVQLAVKNGYNVAVISGGRSDTIRQRMEALGVKHVYIGVESKYEVFNKFLLSIDELPEHTVYVGDDIPDFKPMKSAGLSVSPSDGAPEIKAIADYVSPWKGGEGCVRDILEQVMKVQGKWMNDDAFSW